MLNSPMVMEEPALGHNLPAFEDKKSPIPEKEMGL